jgi:hypothetical protein
MKPVFILHPVTLEGDEAFGGYRQIGPGERR